MGPTSLELSTDGLPELAPELRELIARLVTGERPKLDLSSGLDPLVAVELERLVADLDRASE